MANEFPEATAISLEQIAEIETRVSIATKGPWHTAKRRPALIVAADKARIADCHVGIGMALDEAQFNSEFIAHAREDVPALCNTVRALHEVAEAALLALEMATFAELDNTGQRAMRQLRAALHPQPEEGK